jgi:glyoxylase-like metal-dependent hydrolase (beta-lactamase superfamily II)
MTTTLSEFSGPIYRAQIQLTEIIPLYVHLVKGADYAVWIDSGVKSMFPQLVETMAEAGIRDTDGSATLTTSLRFILHTHSHHDHIGCNGQLKGKTGCLIAAHPHYAAWHADYERHYQEFARPFPHLVPDTPALRAEVLDILDEPRPLNIHIDEGVQFNLGGGVSLEAFSFPGHMLAELGWLESSTRTLILGDAITGLDWPIFHSHLTVQGYRDSLAKIRRIMVERGVERVLFAHFPPIPPSEVESLLDKATAYIDEIEVTMIRILAGHATVTLEQLWTATCERMGRLREFRSLNMVFAHVQDLLARGFIREVASETYALR